MKTIFYTIAFLSVTVSSVNTVSAQIALSDISDNSITDFNGWEGTLPYGFSLSGSSTATTYRNDDAATTTGGMYAVPGMGIGFQASGSATGITLSGTYQNNASVTVNGLRISYDAFTIYDRASRIPSWIVSVNDVQVPELTWTYGDGDITVTFDVADLSIAPGGIFEIGFSAGRGSGSSSTPKIGLNNVSVTLLSDGIPLDVSFLNFTVAQHGNDRVFSWRTAMEKDITDFEIQGSADGRDFNTLHIVPARNNADGYEYEVRKASFDNYTYFRILSNDLSGRVHFSEMAVLARGQQGALSIKNTVTVSELLVYAPAADMTYTIYSLAGQLVQKGQLSEGANIVDVRELIPGHYYFSTASGTQKFIRM